MSKKLNPWLPDTEEPRPLGSPPARYVCAKCSYADEDNPYAQRTTLGVLEISFYIVFGVLGIPEFVDLLFLKNKGKGKNKTCPSCMAPMLAVDYSPLDNEVLREGYRGKGVAEDNAVHDSEVSLRWLWLLIPGVIIYAILKSVGCAPCSASD